MSTRCNIVIHHQDREQAMLYKHCDGMPEVMVHQLVHRLRLAHEGLEKNSRNTSDAEKLAAMLVALSIDESGVPGYVPCLRTPDDISFRYDIFIHDAETYELSFVDDGVRHSELVTCGRTAADWDQEAFVS